MTRIGMAIRDCAITLRQHRSRRLGGVRWSLGLCAAALAVVAASCSSPAPPAATERVSGGPTGSYVVPAGRPQDQAHHRDPTGEPLLRLVLRDLSRCRRDPDEERGPDRLRQRPADRAVRGALRRPRRRQRWRTSLGAQRDRRHQRRQDGRLHRPGPVRPQGLPGADRPRLHQLGPTRRDGVPHRERHPQLLDLRQGLRPPGPHVRAERLLEPAFPPLLGLGMVCLLHRGRQPVELRQRTADQTGRAAPERTSGLRRRGRSQERWRQPQARQQAPGGRTADLRLDRPDLPPPQAQGELGLLRGERDGARLRERSGRDMRAGGPERQHAGHLEPAPLVRHRPGRPSARQHQPTSTSSTTRPRTAPFRRCRGSCPRAR